jgi:hypothetical protein
VYDSDFNIITNYDLEAGLYYIVVKGNYDAYYDEYFVSVFEIE